MKVKSKLADIDFQFGKFEVKRNHLVIHSRSDQTMQSKVYVSPDDIISGLARAFSNPLVWVYFLAFPIFFLVYRRQGKEKRLAKR